MTGVPQLLVYTFIGATTKGLAVREEVKHLQDNALGLIAHGLNLHRSEIDDIDDIAATMAASSEPFKRGIDETCEARVKTLVT